MYIGGWGGKSASDPNREIVFRVCVCVACVRACERRRRRCAWYPGFQGLGPRRRLAQGGCYSPLASARQASQQAIQRSLKGRSRGRLGDS